MKNFESLTPNPTPQEQAPQENEAIDQEMPKSPEDQESGETDEAKAEQERLTRLDKIQQELNNKETEVSSISEKISQDENELNQVRQEITSDLPAVESLAEESQNENSPIEESPGIIAQKEQLAKIQAEVNSLKIEKSQLINGIKSDRQKELSKLFNMPKTSDFQAALQRGDIKGAQDWLDHIVNNQSRFAQYHDTWDSWLNHRESEIKKAKLPEEFKKLKISNTQAFRDAIKSDIPKAKTWLDYIENNRDNFPNYNDPWLLDRQAELANA